MRMPERRQKRVVSSRLGLIQPRRPMSTRIAGRMVTAATNATKIAIAKAGPTVENTGSRVKIIAKNVTATVAADAAITLPIEANARLTASSEGSHACGT